MSLMVWRHTAHVLRRGPDVRIDFQVGVGVMADNVLLPPQEGGHPNLYIMSFSFLMSRFP